MTLLDKISEDIKIAMKSGEKLRLGTLRMVRAQLLEKQVEKRPAGGMTPEDEMSVLISASKKRKESIAAYRQYGRTDLADQEEAELLIIQEYLPQPLSQEELARVISNIKAGFENPSQKDFGKIMSAVMKEVKGRADGKVIQETVKNMLEG